MLSRESVIEGLRSIDEPNYGLSITELQLIKDIIIKEDQVSLTLVLINDDEAYKDQMKPLIIGMIKQLGVEQVHIRFRMISEIEKNQLNDKYKVKSDENESTRTVAPLKVSLLDPDSKVNFIAIASGKGGVGKSTVTVNLAVAMARKGKKVGIIDADIYGFSIPDMMGIEGQPEMQDNAIAPFEKFGVKVISMGFFVQDNAPVIWRGPMLGKMLRNFFNEVTWGELDFVLLDLPPGTGDVALDVHQMLPKSKEIIVTTPHATASFVAARAGAMALHTHHEILGIVENMAYYECPKCKEKDFLFGKGGGAKLAGELHSTLLAQIPLGSPDNHVSEAEYSPSVYKAESSTGIIFLDLAEQILKKYE